MKKEKFRCHPSIIIEKTFVFILFLIFIVIYNFDEVVMLINGGFSLKILIIQISIMVIFLSLLIYNIVIWKTTYIYIENSTIVIRKNALFYRENKYEIEHISNINLEQNLFEKIIGTYKIKIDTDALSTADVTDIEIILSKDMAYQFKNKVLELMNSKSNELNADTKNYIKYSFFDILRHCFFNISLVRLVANLIFLIISTTLSIKITENKSQFTIYVINITAWISIINLFIGDLFRYYNFSIYRIDDKLYVNYGLFKKRKFNIPISRINSINIKQTFISRLCKQYESSIVTIGLGNDKNEGSKILLYVGRKKFLNYMKNLIPEVDIEENLNLKRENKRSIIIRIFYSFIHIFIINIITMYMICVFKAPIDKNLYIQINKISFVFLFIYNCLNYRTNGLYVGKSTISISKGILIKSISIIKYNKLQYIKLNQKPISRVLNLFKGEFGILSGMYDEKIKTGYYHKEIYQNIKDIFIS